MLIDKTLDLSFAIIFFICGIILLLIDYAIPNNMRIILVLVSLLLLWAVWSFYSRLLKGKHVFIQLFRFLRLHKLKFLAKYQGLLLRFEKPIIDFYRNKNKAFFLACLFSLLNLVFSVIEFKIVLLMLGVKASLGVVFMTFSVTGIAFMVPLPMALGSLEAFQASLFSVLKTVPAAAGIGVAMITRSRDLIWFFVALVLSFYVGSLKTIINRAYGDRPIVGVCIIRNGKRHKLDVKINNPSVRDKK